MAYSLNLNDFDVIILIKGRSLLIHIKTINLVTNHD